jgi:hypothetical protein
VYFAVAKPLHFQQMKWKISDQHVIDRHPFGNVTFSLARSPPP